MSESMEQKKEAKKRNLLTAAQKLFLEKGVSKASISEIAEQAQVAKGTFYLYFRDKDDLLDQLLYQISHDVIQQAFAYTEQHKTACFADNVVVFADWIIDYFTQHKDMLRLIHRNFSWPLAERSLIAYSDDPLWHDISARLMSTPIATEQGGKDLFKMIFIIVEMCGTVCYSSIIKHRPDTIDNMKPVLYQMIRRILA